MRFELKWLCGLGFHIPGERITRREELKERVGKAPHYSRWEEIWIIESGKCMRCGKKYETRRPCRVENK